MFLPNKWLLVGSIVLGLALSGFSYWQYNRANNLAERAARIEEAYQARELQFESAIETQRETLIRLREINEQQQQQLEALSQRANQITVERDRANARLEQLRTNLRQQALDDPSGVSDSITSDFHDLMREFQSETTR